MTHREAAVEAAAKTLADEHGDKKMKRWPRSYYHRRTANMLDAAYPHLRKQFMEELLSEKAVEAAAETPVLPNGYEDVRQIIRAAFEAIGEPDA